MDKAQAMKVMAESHRETVKELEGQIYAIGESYRQEREYNEKLEKQNKRYREALEFYADRKHYEVEYYGAGRTNSVVIDYGDEARKALEGDPHESS